MEIYGRSDINQTDFQSSKETEYAAIDFESIEMRYGVTSPPKKLDGARFSAYVTDLEGQYPQAPELAKMHDILRKLGQ